MVELYLARDYPPRLYPEGASIFENKSINTNSHFSEIPRLREAIGIDVWENLKTCPVGLIAKLAESKLVWSGKTVHYLFCRQLRVYKKEIWSLVVDQPLKFSLTEFGEITGLNTNPLPEESFEPDPENYKALWELLKVPLRYGPKFDELIEALTECPFWSADQRKWYGLLFLQAIGLYGLHHNCRIPFESAKRVFDDDALMTYPWGRTAYEFLVDSINGFKDVLLVWAYESVIVFGELYGRKKEETELKKKKKQEETELNKKKKQEEADLKKKKKQEEADSKKDIPASKRTRSGTIRILIPTKQIKNTKSSDELWPESDVEEDERKRCGRIKEYRLKAVQVSPDGSQMSAEFGPSVPFPHIGDKVTTCMRKGFEPSPAIYDPLGPVDPHIASYIRVLIQRSKQDPSPFWSKRVAFIDSWFFELWVHDYKQFEVKPEMVKFKGSGYEKLANGLIPTDIHTKLRWFTDVDHLYGVVNTGGNHWVGFHADLHKEKVDCYDSIVTPKIEKKMLEEFKPVTFMLPDILNRNIPANLRTLSRKKFAFRRMSKRYTRQNTQIGDCGVYALKFVECLALGVSFAGINDKNIQGLRLKMAAEILDEGGNRAENN
ncbi:hypothetical protein BRARA_A02251 [Brassica rapa]|uniref:Ubiquitin-like protease family profile domain-containing protein n=1 Tax=Brassica campestris TaxID=3711 RepID=A0A398ARP1_BRACM|nr:hypothetical protein BRARA_A02251 [Brassica rapa]